MDKNLSESKKIADDRKDPVSERWQEGLENVMDLFKPYLEKGRLTPVCQLEDEDLPLFDAALARVDLSPGLFAAFLPYSAAGTIAPPDSIKEWQRIDKGEPSCKIIILRPGNGKRVLCAEISEHAHRPGVDIFQEGGFLGKFDYDTNDICISELAKVVRAHAWGKEKWQRNDYINYTLNWFEKTVYLEKADVTVDTNFSFFHSPTLMKTNRVDALFQLLYGVLNKRIREEDPLKLKKALQGTKFAMSGMNGAEKKESADQAGQKQAGQKYQSRKIRLEAWESLAETYLLDLLNLVKKLELMDFSGFTNAENHGFQNEFVRTVRKLSSDLDEIVIMSQPGSVNN